MMFTFRHIGIAVAVVGLLCAILIPDWFEDPRELAIGEWQGVPRKIRAEVTEDKVEWRAGGYGGKFSYRWVQTDDEPYRVAFRRGSSEFEADVIFDGPDEVVLLPLIFDRLPDPAKEYIRSYNKARDRAEDDMRFLFQRVKQK